MKTALITLVSAFLFIACGASASNWVDTGRIENEKTAVTVDGCLAAARLSPDLPDGGHTHATTFYGCLAEAGIDAR